jgi:SWI/SNF-related matrix-associated actin-dependent regulator 1 of chromatin subfamily A
MGQFPELVPDALLSLAARAGIAWDLPVRVPAELWESLYAYQQEGVKRVVHQFKGRCLLADEMGLGKTRQALGVILHYAVPTLVICPSFLQTTWRRVLGTYGCGATVCSYGTVAGVSATYGLIIVDEAHYLKTFESQRTQAILPLLLATPRVLLLTGTPCPNRPEELFPLLHALRPSLVPTWHAYSSRYCNPRRTPWNPRDTRGSDRECELKWLLGRAYWVRRTKQCVLHDLPSKHSSTLYVEAEASSGPVLARLNERLQSALTAGSRLAQSLISEMYRATCAAKVDAAVELVVGHRPLDRPVVIFAHHQRMLDAAEAALPRDGTVGRIDGKTSLTRRQQVVDGIQSGALNVALLSMGAAGVGLTLTNACTAYFLEIPWCPAVLRQCEDRIHRIGQTRLTHIYYVLANDTLDMHVWRTIHRKERVGARIGQ